MEIKKLFEEEVLPKLRKKRGMDKYRKAFTNLCKNANKTLRTGELLKNKNQARAVAKAFVKIDVAEETKPSTKYIKDELNDVTKFSEMAEFIEMYGNLIMQHAVDDPNVLNVISTKLGKTNENTLAWIREISIDSDLDEYNKVIDELVKSGFDLISRGYGYLKWTSMSNRYELTDFYKNALGGRK